MARRAASHCLHIPGLVATPSCLRGSMRKPSPFNSESGMLCHLHRAGVATTRPACCFVTGIFILIMLAGLLANWLGKPARLPIIGVVVRNFSVTFQLFKNARVRLWCSGSTRAFQALRASSSLVSRSKYVTRFQRIANLFSNLQAFLQVCHMQ